MATIKLNSGGQVILRGGLPSCTCCETTLCVVFLFATEDEPDVIRQAQFEMTPGVDGYIGYWPGPIYLNWNSVDSRWEFDAPGYGGDINGDVTNGAAENANPAQFYSHTYPYPGYTASVTSGPCVYPTLYVEYIVYTTVYPDEPASPYRVSTTAYATMTRSGPGSVYTDAGAFVYLSWSFTPGKWELDVPGGFHEAMGPSDITNPVGVYADKFHPERDPMMYYEEGDADIVEATVSLTPLP
jgi:hypothetical protein